MRVLILAALLGLASCAAPGHRDRAAPIAAIVSFDPARFAGVWHEVAAIGRAPGARWQVGAEPFTIATTTDGAGTARLVGPGRIEAAAFPAPLWVLWVDAGYRSAVIGSPDGRFAMLLDRAATMPADRLAAAREVLGWNGYDLAGLR